MVTMNISLTSSEQKLVNEIIKKYDYANRSEFFRALIRLVMYDESILKKVIGFPIKPKLLNSKAKPSKP